MQVWADCVTFAAAGATAGTYSSLGTITVRKGASKIIAIQYTCGSTIPTSGQNGAARLRVQSADLGISNQEFWLNWLETDGIATNDKESPLRAGIIPVSWDTNNIDLARVDFELTSNVDMTGGWDGAIGLIYSDATPSLEYTMALFSRQHLPARGGAVTESDAGLTAASETAFATGITIPSGTRELRGLNGVIVPNAPTAGEATLGYTSFSSSGIPNFQPQRWVNNVNWSASLGN